MKALFKHQKAMSKDKPFGYTLGTPSKNAIAPGGKSSLRAVSPLGVYAQSSYRRTIQHLHVCKNRILSPELAIFKGTLLTLLFAIPQVPLVGSISGEKVLAQTTSCPVGTAPATLNWSPASNVAGIVSQNLSVNGINAAISFTESSPGQVIDTGETLISSDDYGGVPGPNLRFNIGFADSSIPNSPFDGPAPVGSNATLTITFSQPVTLASPLTLLDIDRAGARDTAGGTTFIYQDRVTINAFNGATPVGVSLTALGPYVRVTGNVAEGINENAFPFQSFGNVSASIPGQVNRIQIVYEPGTEFGEPLQDETIGLARLNICAPTGTGSIGDTVFNDANGNNVQDPGETGIPNLSVTLTSPGADGNFGTADDPPPQTTTTDSSGNYRFSNLPAGTYTVAVPTPTGSTPTLTQTNPVTLTTGQNLDTVDFGFRFPIGSIGDTVFNDANGNNVQDPGETGIPNLSVTLTSPGADGNFGTADDPPPQTTTTDSSGNYRFSNLPAGTYTVAVPTPTGSTPTLTQTNPVTLTTGQNLDTVDFGFRFPTGSIGDSVFNDANGNNVQDPGETGIPNLSVTLTSPGADGNFGTADDPPPQTTTTDSSGNYRFSNLPPGTYTVAVPTPTGSTPTLTQTNPVTLATGQNLDTVDFGFRLPTGSIGNTVFTDTNGNNVQDPGEPGIPNVPVTLTGAGPDGNFGTADDPPPQTINTDNNGRYTFTNLPPGTYRVAVPTPNGFNPTLTQSNPLTLAANQNITTANFGFQPSGSIIGDTVFNDVNGNNVQDPGEPGLRNVTVTLTGAGPDGNFGTADDPPPQTTTTDNNGNYRFINLPPGTYRVAIPNPPAGTPTLTQSNPVTLAANQNLDTVDFGFNIPRVGATEPNLLLVKRITNVFRNGQPISGINFSSFENDADNTNDEQVNQSQPVLGVRDLQTPLQSGDEVEYTIYFLAQNVNNARFCDLIPEGTSYANRLAVSGVSAEARVLSPLAPLEDFANICANTNSNGALVLGPVNIPDSSAGSIRFRVRVN